MWQAVATCLVVYAAVVRLLRYRRAVQIARRVAAQPPTGMSCTMAQGIVRDLAELEFPSSMGIALGFALYRVRLSALHASQAPC